MSRYEVRLLQSLEADSPIEAAEAFIEAIVDNGLRTFLLRTQDMDNDPEGDNIVLVSNRTAFSLSEAAAMYGVDLTEFGIDDDEDEDEDDDELDSVPTDPQPIVAEWETPDDDDSVVNIPSD
jgi:hypothetical protein